MRARILPVLLLCLHLLPLSGQAGQDFYVLLIRSLEPPDHVVLEKVKINKKTELYRLDREGPLTSSTYKRLPKLRFTEIYALEVTERGLAVRTRAQHDLTALPANFKDWPTSPVSPAAIIQRSVLTGRPPNQRNELHLSLAQGWRVYFFLGRPDDAAIAFALAEVQNTQAAWEAFLERFPTGPQTPAAATALAEIYLDHSREALDRFQAAWEGRTPGYGYLGEARQWFNRLNSLNVSLPAQADVEARLAQLEADISNRLEQAQQWAENAEFSASLETLEPLLHFRAEFPPLANLHEGILQMAASHYVHQARQALAEERFEEALEALDTAARYRALEEIPAVREEIHKQRTEFERRQEIDETTRRAQEEMARNNYAAAFKLLAPLALRYPAETRLQDNFASLRRVYREALLAEVVQVEQVHTPIRGPADEEALLQFQQRLVRLAEFEPTTEVAVWRDRLSTHLGDYYRQRAAELGAPEGEPLSPLAFAYLQQAHHFILNKADLAQYTPWRNRLEQQLHIRLALDFRDQTPEGGRDYLVAEMAARVGAAIQETGFPHVSIVDVRQGVPSARPVIEFVVQLVRAQVREDSQSQSVPSDYSAGTRQVPNPAWQEAKAAYDQAVQSHSQVLARVEQNRRQRRYGKKEQQADSQALAQAEAALREAKARLDAVPALIEEEEVRAYEFTRRTITRVAEMRLAYRWVHTATGILEAQDFLEAKESAEDVERTGVHAADKHGHRNQSAKLPDGETLLNQVLRRIQQQLAERALSYLKTFIDRNFERAQQKADRAERESAAEDYLRFLYNTTPEDPRRKQALSYLEREFRLVALQEWIGVSRPGYTAERD